MIKQTFENNQNLEQFKYIYEATFNELTEKLYVDLANAIKTYVNLYEELSKTTKEHLLEKNVKATQDTAETINKNLENIVNEIKILIDNTNKFDDKSYWDVLIKLATTGQNEQAKLQNIQKISLDDISKAKNHILQILDDIRNINERYKIARAGRKTANIANEISELSLEKKDKSLMKGLWLCYNEMRILSFMTIEKFASELLAQNEEYPNPKKCLSHQKSIVALDLLDEENSTNIFESGIENIINNGNKDNIYNDSILMSLLCDYVIREKIYKDHLDQIDSPNFVATKQLKDLTVNLYKNSESFKEELFNEASHR